LFFFGKFGIKLFFEGLMLLGFFGTFSAIVPARTGVMILGEVGLSVCSSDKGRLASVE
jgi:hypothetical protein